LQRIFYTFLEQSPEVKITKRSSVHLRMDATYFKQVCLVCYQDHEDGYTQLIRVTDGEHYTEIKEDLDNLIKLGVQIESITTDGHKSALKAIRKALPDVTVQRCLVHIQRMCFFVLLRSPLKAWCGARDPGMQRRVSCQHTRHAMKTPLRPTALYLETGYSQFKTATKASC